MKPQMLDSFFVDAVYLPFVQNVIDMTEQPPFLTNDIYAALDGNWNTTDWGDRVDFWKYFITHYGHYRIMYDYCEEVNNTLVCDHFGFNKGAYPVLLANHEKYDRLAKSLKKDYNVLAPYNIEEEHSSGADYSKLSTTYAQHIDTDAESSMDSSALVSKNQTTYGSHTDDVTHEHDRSVHFKGNVWDSGMSEIEHKADSRIGNIGNHSFSELIEKELKLARYNLWDIISHDLLDNICLKYFMSC